MELGIEPEERAVGRNKFNNSKVDWLRFSDLVEEDVSHLAGELVTSQSPAENYDRLIACIRSRLLETGAFRLCFKGCKARAQPLW